MATITVVGSWGTLTADAASGLVSMYRPGEGCETPTPSGYHGYHDIETIDVAEWHRAYPDRDITAHEHDILDIGFWDKQQNYTAPELDWRSN